MTEGDKERYRVQAAIAAMQGILSCKTLRVGATYEEIAECSKNQADALMKELGIGVESAK